MAHSEFLFSLVSKLPLVFLCTITVGLDVKIEFQKLGGEYLSRCFELLSILSATFASHKSLFVHPRNPCNVNIVDPAASYVPISF